MKFNLLLGLAFLLLSTGMGAQSKKAAVKQTAHTYPESFIISRTDFEALFTAKQNEVIKNPGNKYIDKAVLQLSAQNGDMKFLRLKLAYFAKANLMIQVNGEYSTQVFVLSDDKSVSYKGRVTKENVTMTKCKQDEIYSE